ncbi:MAG TPA: hypothetical protein VNO30_30845 [Kofleriaceae bacterium]|nr:hypothetical protein [Kofleriaceae bacterium]
MLSERPHAEVVELPGAGLPADRGLSSLGLLMQLAGGAFAAGACVIAVVAILALREQRGEPPGSVGWILAVAGLCAARSWAHRAAGTQLLYGGRWNADGTPASPLGGVRRYIAIALGQTALLALLGRAALGLPVADVLAWCAGLALWPLALAALLASGALARFEAELPHGEDKGFEAASILMTVLGATGLFAAGAILLANLETGLGELARGPGSIVIGALGLLLLRSWLHVRAGLVGLRETSIDRSVELAGRYAELGVVSSLWFGGVLLLAAIANGMDVWGMMLVAALCWLMMLWPLIVRRFFSDRQLADLLAGARAAHHHHRRAPDAGLAGLGWLLAGHAALTASFLVPQLFAGSIAASPIAEDARWLAALAAGIGDGSPWWSALVIALGAWAGVALLRMSPHHRLLAVVYGAVAAIVTLAEMWPILARAMQLSVLGSRGAELVLPVALTALRLAIPAAAVLLATRAIAPAARARYRRGRPA